MQNVPVSPGKPENPRIVKPNGCVILVAAASTVIVLVPAFSVPDEYLTALVREDWELLFLCFWTLASIPIAFAMPRLRASFLGGIGHVPSDAYVLPRWLVRFVIGAMIGQIASHLVLAVARDHRFIWLVASLICLTVALYAGAARRLRKPAYTEFSLIWCWPRGKQQRHKHG